MTGESGGMKKRPTRLGNRRMCCVVGCGNREGTESLIFYRFPERDPERKQQWVSAVGRINPDGTSWCPNANSRICSAHFVDGHKGTLRADKNYLPTIFPVGTNNRKTVRRTKCDATHSMSVPSTTANQLPSDPDRLPTATAQERLDTKSDPGCLPVIPHEKLDVRRSSNIRPTLYKKIQTVDGTTQLKRVTKRLAAQPVLEKFDSKMIKQEPGSLNPDEGSSHDIEIECTPELVKVENNLTPFTNLVDASVQTDIAFSGFGLRNLRTDREFKSWCGLTRASFVALEEILDWKVSESHLLLCLAKLKTNLTFRALSSLFQIQREQAVNIFVEVLNTLYDKAKHLSSTKIQETTSPTTTDFKCVVGTSSEGGERDVRFLVALDDQNGKIISISRRTSLCGKLHNLEQGRGT